MTPLALSVDGGVPRIHYGCKQCIATAVSIKALGSDLAGDLAGDLGSLSWEDTGQPHSVMREASRWAPESVIV